MSSLKANMLKSPHGTVPPIEVGLTSVVLGTLGCGLFFLPILGIPLGVCGLLFGAAGMVGAAVGKAANLRWSLSGVIVSMVAIVNGLVITFAALGYEPNHPTPRLWQIAPDRPFVSPPARPWHADTSKRHG